MDKKNIVVIGSLNMDWVIPVNHTPVEGETILADGYTEVPGGKGANQACAAGKLKGNVSMLGLVGDDEIGDKLINNLKLVNVDVSRIEKSENINSGLALINVNSKGNNSIVVLPGANGRCDIKYIEKNIDIIEKSDIVLLQMEIPIETVEYVITVSKNLKKQVILNPAPAPDSLSDEVLSNIDILTPNETELEKISGKNVKTVEDAIEASKSLLNRGVKNIIATLGEKGALLVNKDEVKEFKALKVDAVDTTAAGDSFNGAMAVYLSEGHTISEAIEFANKVSSIAVTRKGAQTSIPERSEIEI
ncbi:MAG: ribokinase [Clostridium sp.]|nr:ribokinase [Clostridium sp.]